MQARLDWQEGMRFVAHNRQHETVMDVIEQQGGSDQGPTPKEQLLNAMMGCTAMDVISILKKMRIPPRSFHIESEVQKNAEHPVHFTHAKLAFHIDGEVPASKAVKAIEASLTKYCGVNYMASKTCDIEWGLILNGIESGHGQASFVDP